MREHPDPTVGKLLKVQQLGIQYLLYMQELAKKRAELYGAEGAKEKESIQKMRALKRQQEAKIRQLEERNANNEYLV